MRRTATASNSARQGQLGAERSRAPTSCFVASLREEPAMKVQAEGTGGLATGISIKGKEGNRRRGAPFQKLQFYREGRSGRYRAVVSRAPVFW